MRRFFRFSVRDLLWLTLVVAVGLGWFARERQLNDDVAVAQNESRLETRYRHWWQAAARHLKATLTEEAGWQVKLRPAEIIVVSPAKKRIHKSMPEGPVPDHLE